MHELIKNLALIVVGAPLLGSIIAGLFGKKIGRAGAHWATIILMAISLGCAAYIFKLAVIDGYNYNGVIYTWAQSGSFKFNIGFLIDQLTAVMLLIVTFVSFVVHIYSVGYMEDDPGYQRFFSYVSLFTFSMLLLVTADNFLQLFIGWEGVGLVSYLLIGFWFKKPTAASGSLKAFVVNRIGDFGFILGIAAILDYFGGVDYNTVFANTHSFANTMVSIWPGIHCSIITLICILLFVGAMGKSAQVPLHIWLPESMEGPTPISALIHAATMVTAGVYMVARMSPMFEFSVTAQSLVLVIGATGALFLGILAFVEFDIKRVIAYSTMSQLGYMMAADGISAYNAGIFHLLTHACFKALLFLSAGSVIIAMHHEQDMRKMGGLRKYIPVTYVCFLIGALALSAIPPFSGYYSKDAIIEAVGIAKTPGATYAYWCLLIGAFVTAYYIFRAFFMAFHTEERIAPEVKGHIKENWVMLIPLILLAIPSVIIGAILVKPMLFDAPNLFGSSLTVLPQNNVMAQLATHFHGVLAFTLHSVKTVTFWVALSGIIVAYINVAVMPKFPAALQRAFPWVHKMLVGQFGFDWVSDNIFVKGTRGIAGFFYNYTDTKIIDDLMVNGSGRNISRVSRLTRRIQTGYLYHYVFVMILGLLGFMLWMFFSK